MKMNGITTKAGVERKHGRDEEIVLKKNAICGWALPKDFFFVVPGRW